MDQFFIKNAPILRPFWHGFSMNCAPWDPSGPPGLILEPPGASGLEFDPGLLVYFFVLPFRAPRDPFWGSWVMDPRNGPAAWAKPK